MVMFFYVLFLFVLCKSSETCLSHSPLIQFHVDKKGRVNYAQTDMLIHVVNNQTNTILDVERYTFLSEINLSRPIAPFTPARRDLPYVSSLDCPLT